MSLSAHKLGGPKGIGALYIGQRVRNPRPLLPGGGQERGVRSGTEATAQIAGFAKAVELRREDQSFTVPRGLRVLREVSGDRRLKNAALAGHVPPEEELLAEAAGNGITPLHGSPECGKIT